MAKPINSYHHGHLREELLRLGLEALETEGADELSLRSLSERAGVSKTAPYRHFRDKELFLGALADEGFRLLCMELERTAGSGKARVAAMGKAYMDFAVAHPALYRLMNSPLVCSMPDELMLWARKSLMLLARTLALASPNSTVDSPPDINAAAAAWGYIHGIVLIRIDKLFPADLGEPDWDRLSSVVPLLR
jgi:AcrR family transcriptional regulator